MRRNNDIFGLKKTNRSFHAYMGYFLLLRGVEMKMFAFVKKGETLIY